jgi:very-short-patch-repair endonuclease
MVIGRILYFYPLSLYGREIQREGIVVMAVKLVQLAKNLRQNSTNAEKIMWGCLRAKRLNGLKFRRQEPIGKYIVDFVCYDKKLIIELDGGQHAMPDSKDSQRDSWLESKGFKVLRFWNNDVLVSTESVLEVINITVKHGPLSLSLPRKGGED